MTSPLVTSIRQGSVPFECSQSEFERYGQPCSARLTDVTIQLLNWFGRGRKCSSAAVPRRYSRHDEDIMQSLSSHSDTSLDNHIFKLKAIARRERLLLYPPAALKVFDRLSLWLSILDCDLYLGNYNEKSEGK